MTVDGILELKQLPDEREWSASREEIEELFWKIKGLRLEQRRQEAFWSATNESLQRAYLQLEQQERELDRAYGQIQRYMENINEGLLLIDQNLIIQDQHSKYLRELFRTTQIAGRNLIDFIYPDQSAQQAERSELEGFLEILFKSRNASDQMINDVNPLMGKTIIVGETRSEKCVVDARFTRILGDENVESVMVIFVDRTQESEIQRKLQLQETRHESEVETISAILKNGPAALLDFIDESEELIGSLKHNWARLDDRELRTTLFKEVHSLKGVSKYFGLHHVSSLAHKLEDLISATERGTPASQHAFYQVIGELESGIGAVRELNDKLLHFSKSIAESSVDDPTSSFLDSLQKMGSEMADELGKQVNVVAGSVNGEIPFLSKLRKPLIHLVRNAVDHGIEDPYQRLAAKKPMQGTVGISARNKDGNCVVTVQDDGAGIDFDAVEQRALELGLIAEQSSPSKAELLRVMFSSRFSSNQQSSEISGRGLGLDIVRDVLRAVGGRIHVNTVRGRGTIFRLSIPLQDR